MGGECLTNQEKKRYLLRYRNNEAEINRMAEELTRWESKARRVTSNWGDTPGGRSEQSDRVQVCVEHIIKLQNQLAEQIDLGVQLRESIEAAISAVDDERLQLLLRYRYIDGMTWEKIAVTMRLDYRWVLRLHGKALIKLTIESHC